MPKLFVVFDCDGVLTDNHSSWGILHEYFGSRDNAFFAELYEKELISYLDWMKIDVALMIHSHGKPITRRELEAAFANIHPRREAKLVVEKLKSMGLKIAVVSSGVNLLVEKICRELGIEDCLSNKLLFHGDILIPGGEAVVPLREKWLIIDLLAKQHGYTLDNTMYVGDSKWDIPVFQKVKYSVAVEPCGEACRYAKYVISSLAQLPDVIEEILGGTKK